ncbi:MAG: lipopolysaccharide biosynthesis protein [Hyphomicrobiales bacterium]
MTAAAEKQTSLFGELARILRHSSVYGLGSVSRKLIGFLMVPVYTRFLDPAAYGIVELLDLTLSIGGLVLYDLIIEALFRFYYLDEDPVRRRNLVSTALWTHVGLSVAAVGLTELFAGPVSRAVLGSTKYAPYLHVSLLTFVFMQINAIPLGYLRVRQRSTIYAAASLTSLVVGLTLNIVFIVIMHMGVWGVLYSNLAANALMAAWLLPMTARDVGFHWKPGAVTQMFRYGGPLIPAGIGNFSLNYSNRLFLNMYTALADVGLYALGAKFSFMMSVLIIQPFLNIWDAKMFEIADRSDAGTIYARVCTYSVFVTLFAALGLSLLIPDVLTWMVPPSFYPAAGIVPILSLGYVFQLLYYNFYVGLLIRNKTGKLAAVMVTCAVIGLALNRYLIQPFGLHGAAWSMCLSYVVLAGLCYAAAQATHRIPYEWSRLGKMAAIAAILFFVGRSIHGPAPWVGPACRIAALVLFPAFLFAIRFFQSDEIELLRSRLGRFGVRVPGGA